MAMFLSRIKKALNLGTKNITVNGTYNASSDGYDGYSSVEVNVAGVTPTPITPSNVSPVALTSGSAVTPTANGYAIESYSNISPYEGGAITSGGIYKATTSGYAIGEEPETLAAGSGTDETIVNGKYYHAVGNGVAIQEYTNITPSNSSPVSLSSGDYYKPTASGKAISSLSEVAPSNANPPEMYNGGIYKIKTRNGYLISTVNIVVPSDSNPPLLSNDNSWYRLNGASGYLYSTVQPKVKTGTFQTSTSGEVTVTLGFQPKYLAFEGDGSTSSGKHFMYIYNADTSTSVCYFANASNYPTTRSMTSGANNIVITSTGFKFTMTTSPVRTCRYFAIG